MVGKRKIWRCMQDGCIFVAIGSVSRRNHRNRKKHERWELVE